MTDDGIDPEVKERLRIIGSPVTFAEHASRGDWTRSPHLTYCADRFMAKLIEGRREKRWEFLDVEVAVRSGKTFLFGKWAPAWAMMTFPGLRAVLCMYSDDRAEQWSADVRDICAEWGPTLFGVSVRRDRTAAKGWQLSNGSTMRAVGINGAITGEGFDLFIIDDPIKNIEEADSPTTKRKMVDWYYGVPRTRLEPGGLMVLTMARWREDDLAGMVCKPSTNGRGDAWETVRLPAIAEAPLGEEAAWTDIIGRRHGEALWPERWPVEALEQIRDTVDPQTWESLYQQNPTAREGGTFKIGNWREIGMAPKNMRAVVRAWDLSASLRKGDWTAGVKMGLGDNNEIYVLDVQRVRLDPAGVQNLVVITATQDGTEVVIGMEEEKGASGKANSATFAQQLLGYQFRPEPVSGSKEVRAAGYAAHQGNGLIYLVCDGSWDVEAFKEEHRTFPAGRHDDQVDAAALGFRMLALGGFGPVEVEMVWNQEDVSPLVARALARSR
jgi:predicted phage terminase large subunit-like protein